MVKLRQRFVESNGVKLCKDAGMVLCAVGRARRARRARRWRRWVMGDDVLLESGAMATAMASRGRTTSCGHALDSSSDEPISRAPRSLPYQAARLPSHTRHMCWML